MVKEKVTKKDLSKQEVRKVLHGEHNSRGRGRSAAEKRESYAEYRENKKKVLDLEKRNFQHLILFPASDKDTNKKKFYNMIGNSAVIYVHEIGPRIDRKPTLRIDLDSGERSSVGMCSIADLKTFEEKMAGIGVKRMKEYKGYEDLVMFKLNREYSKDEIRGMIREHQKSLDTLNKILYAEVLHPDIHRQILDLKRIIPSKVKNMDKTYREVVGMKMVDTLMELVETYSQMAHGDIEELEGGKRMLLKLDMLLAEISMMSELQLWDVAACIRAASIAAGAKQLIKGKIVNKYETTN